MHLHTNLRRAPVGFDLIALPPGRHHSPAGVALLAEWSQGSRIAMLASGSATLQQPLTGNLQLISTGFDTQPQARIRSSPLLSSRPWNGWESGSHCAAGKDTRFGVDNVGTPAASLTTYLAAQAFQPELVISLGTAGGFKTKGAAIGSVFVGTSTVNHDRRISLPVRT